MDVFGIKTNLLICVVMAVVLTAKTQSNSKFLIVCSSSYMI